MRKYLWIILLIFVLQSPAQQFKVMTFNIRYDNPSDSIYSWNGRKSKVFSMLKEEKPDLIGMQEVLKRQVDDLEREMRDYDWFGCGRDDGQEKGEYCPIFYNTNVYENLGGSTFWLSTTPKVPGSKSWDAACTRIVTWMKARDKRNDKIIYFFNTHFDHISQLAREHSALMLLKAVDSLAGNSTSVITGDFNQTSRSAMYQILTSGFTPAGELAVPPIPEPEYTFINFPFNPEGGQIDFIFIKNYVGITTEQFYADHYGEGGRYPSDHFPVVATFVIK